MLSTTAPGRGCNIFVYLFTLRYCSRYTGAPANFEVLPPSVSARCTDCALLPEYILSKHLHFRTQIQMCKSSENISASGLVAYLAITTIIYFLRSRTKYTDQSTERFARRCASDISCPAFTCPPKHSHPLSEESLGRNSP